MPGVRGTALSKFGRHCWKYGVTDIEELYRIAAFIEGLDIIYMGKVQL
jgi:hypothetical protein